MALHAFLSVRASLQLIHYMLNRRKVWLDASRRCIDIPAVLQSVCLQASDPVGAKAKGFELLTHRCRSSIYELAVI